MSGDTPDKSLLQVVSRVIDTLTTDNRSYDTLISVLSLICLVTILNRNQNPTTLSAPITSGNPLQKILGELTKGDAGSAGGSGPSPDMLMSLLPLINSPQLKSKLNPSNIATIMSLVNSLGGSSTEKSESPKQDKAVPKAEPKPEPKPEETPAAAVTASADIHSEKQTSEIDDPDKKGLGRYLNWKTNF